MPASGTSAPPDSVDFRFAPASHLTIISLPRDWQKSFVSSSGSLAFDFGPGPYARAFTEITPGLLDSEVVLSRLTLEDPRVPLVTVEWGSASHRISQRVFSMIPEPVDICPSPPPGASVVRTGGLTGTPEWASPADSVEGAFRGVAWGTNRPVIYRARIEPGERKTVALGFCEPYKSRPGSRLLEARVEGASPLTIDPLKDGLQNTPYCYFFDAADADGDGWLAIEVHASALSPDPNVTLNAFWIFPPGLSVTAGEVFSGVARGKAELVYACGNELAAYARSPRLDAAIVTVESPDRPVLRIRTRRELTFDPTGRHLAERGLPFLLASPLPESAVRESGTWTLVFPAGTTRFEYVVVHGDRGRERIEGLPDLEAARARAEEFWKRTEILPPGRITVPDPGIQYLLDAAVRTVYQVQDCVDGRVQFQPGPSVYRGLWSGDAIVTALPALMLGDTAGMRSYLEILLLYQMPDGRIRVMVPYNSIPETPMVLAAMFWYASSSGNDTWLRSRWDAVQRGLGWVEQARASTLVDSSSPSAGLMPPGFLDGGVAGETADYASTWWAMTALEEAVRGAERLGFLHDAQRWRSLLEKFVESYRRAAGRGLRTDAKGNTYLPILVDDTSSSMPQKGQYAFLIPVRYGRFFLEQDSLSRTVLHGTLAMLDSNLAQGIVVGSGWMEDGVWPWLAGVHAMAHLASGNPQRAVELLLAYARHASPLGTWVEEQQPSDVGTRVSGDASNAQASAVFVHLVRDLIVQERAGRLELLSGIPRRWLSAGSVIALENTLTYFGPLSLRVEVAPDGRSAAVTIRTPHDPGTAPVPRLHLRELSALEFVPENGAAMSEEMDIPWGQDIRLTFRRGARP